MSGPPLVLVVAEEHREAVRRVSPLAVDLSMACGPVVVPVGVAALPGDAEEQDRPSSQVLRAFFEENPFEGMGSVTRAGWLLVAQDEDTLVFTQRSGPVGLGVALVMSRTEHGWEPVSLGGTRVVLPEPGERVERVLAARAEGGGVVLTWAGEGGLDGIPWRVLRRVEVLETPAAVHVLVVSAANPAVARRAGWDAGVGTAGSAHVDLREPLDGRALFDDSGVPAHDAEITPGPERSRTSPTG